MPTQKAKAKPRPVVQPLPAAPKLTPAQIALVDAQNDVAEEDARPLDMLDESVDPLTLAAQAPERKKKPPPVPPPPVSLMETPINIDHLAQKAAALGIGDAPTGGNSDDAIARERAYNDSFKDEVERMIREEVLKERHQQIKTEPDVPKPPPAPSPAAENKVYGTSAELLNAVGLPQYTGR